MTCPNCGAEASSKACPNCGHMRRGRPIALILTSLLFLILSSVGACCVVGTVQSGYEVGWLISSWFLVPAAILIPVLFTLYRRSRR